MVFKSKRPNLFLLKKRLNSTLQCCEWFEGYWQCPQKYVKYTKCTFVVFVKPLLQRQLLIHFFYFFFCLFPLFLHLFVSLLVISLSACFFPLRDFPCLLFFCNHIFVFIFRPVFLCLHVSLSSLPCLRICLFLFFFFLSTCHFLLCLHVSFFFFPSSVPSFCSLSLCAVSCLQPHS